MTKIIQLEQLKKKERNEECNVESKDDEKEKPNSYKKGLTQDMDTNYDYGADVSINSLSCPEYHFDSLKRYG